MRTSRNILSNLKESVSKEEDLTLKLAQFFKDYDYYEYKDQYDSFEDLYNEILNDEVEGFKESKKFLKVAIDYKEGTPEDLRDAQILLKDIYKYNKAHGIVEAPDNSEDSINYVSEKDFLNVYKFLEGSKYEIVARSKENPELGEGVIDPSKDGLIKIYQGNSNGTDDREVTTLELQSNYNLKIAPVNGSNVNIPVKNILVAYNEIESILNNDKEISSSDLQRILGALETNTGVDYETLYNYYIKRFSKPEGLKEASKAKKKPCKSKEPNKRLFMNQGNVYVYEQTKGNKRTYVVGEDLDRDKNTVENANIYEDKDEAMVDFFERVGIDPTYELKESLKEITEEGLEKKYRSYTTKALRDEVFDVIPEYQEPEKAGALKMLTREKMLDLLMSFVKKNSMLEEVSEETEDLETKIRNWLDTQSYIDKEGNTYKYIIQADYNDRLEESILKEIFESEDQKSKFYEIIEEAYSESYPEISNEINQSIIEGLNLEEDRVEEVNDILNELIEIEPDYEYYLEQEVPADIVVTNTADEWNVEYSQNTPTGYYGYNSYKEWAEEGRNSWKFLCKSQGYTDKDLWDVCTGKDTDSKFLKSAKEEIINTTSGLNAVVFLKKMTLGEVLSYDKGKSITIEPGTRAGLVDFWSGAGSILELELEKSVVLPGGTYEVKVDGCDGNYGIQEIYGVGKDFWE